MKYLITAMVQIRYFYGDYKRPQQQHLLTTSRNSVDLIGNSYNVPHELCVLDSDDQGKETLLALSDVSAVVGWVGTQKGKTPANQEPQ